MEGYIYNSQKSINSTEKYFIWHIQGGLGKNIAATALIRTIKETYNDRKLIIVSSWPEVFLNNPKIDRVYQLGQTPYFYEDYIENKDVIISKHEPYHQTAHIKKEKHLIHNWCDLMGLEYKGQLPEIYPNYPQKMLVGAWTRNKPILILQTAGGPIDSNRYSYSWTRDIPIELAQSIVNKYKTEYHIIQITRPGGYSLNDVERMDNVMSNIELFSLLVASTKRILIDSSLQHAATALGLTSTVLWIGTSPVVFGYKLHTNIQANLPKRANQLIGSYIFDYQFDNNLHECPYIEIGDIFNIEDIIKSI
jgi:hypothetical protein